MRNRLIKSQESSLSSAKQREARIEGCGLGNNSGQIRTLRYSFRTLQLTQDAPSLITHNRFVLIIQQQV
jgi:hypothetical protein